MNRPSASGVRMLSDAKHGFHAEGKYIIGLISARRLQWPTRTK